MGAMWPCDPELILRGIYSGTADDSNLFFHHDYFDELLGDHGFTVSRRSGGGTAVAIRIPLNRTGAEARGTAA